MHNKILYLLLIIVSPMTAMQHKWTKSKGSHKKAQMHHAPTQSNLSKKENALQKKLARLQTQAQSINAQDEISALIGIITIQAATRHRNMNNRP